MKNLCAKPFALLWGLKFKNQDFWTKFAADIYLIIVIIINIINIIIIIIITTIKYNIFQLYY